MRKFILFAMVILLAGTIGTVYSQIPNKVVNEEFQIYKGWNLVDFPLYSDIIKYSDKLETSESTVYFMLERPFSYNYVQGDDGARAYASKLVDNNIDDSILDATAVWFFSKTDLTFELYAATLPSKEDLSNNIDSVNNAYQLFNGWNLVSINSLMIDRTLNDFKGNCDINKIYIFKSDLQEWQRVTFDEGASKEQVGGGLAVKVRNDCQMDFGGSARISSIPSLPTTEVTCEDSDGDNQFRQGSVVVTNDDGSSRYSDRCVHKLEEKNAGHYAKVDGVLYDIGCESENCYVAEAICLNNKDAFKVYECSNGCQEGSCNK